MDSEYGFPYSLDAQKHYSTNTGVDAYDYLPEIPRLYYKSHIFGGTHVRDARTVNLFVEEESKICRKQITTPKLLERMFLEILSNAIDNIYKSREMGINPGGIEITMDSDTISIKNGGNPIPVGLHKYFTKQGAMGTAVELIFGVIGAGSNTSESVIKQGGGQNGYGAKLVNVFARLFQVEVGDNIRGFYQNVVWTKNMTEKSLVQIVPSKYTLQDNWIQDVDVYGRQMTINVPTMIPDPAERYNGENFTKITWKQDFRKMGQQCYTKDELQLYMKYAAEATFHSKVPITFNGKVLNYSNVSDFIKLFNANSSNTPIIHYEWKNQMAPQFSGKQLDQYVAAGQLTPSVELIIFDTPDAGQHISYCNGIYNVDGGTHTNTAYQEVLKVIKEVIQSTKGFDKSGLDLGKITIADLKKHLTIVVNFRCDEPSFKGQDKELLVKPTPKINISIDEAAKIKKWKVVDRIYTTLTGKHISTAGGKGSGHGGRIKDDFNFEEANWIGTNRQGETVLILCEGDSAGSNLLNWILATPERKYKYAILPLRGKLKNVTDMSVLEMEQVKEIMKIIKYAGLKYGIDYRTPEGIAKLKYGCIYCMTDADTDGSHIQSLLMNFLYRVFPTFIQAGRFFYVPTPVIRVMMTEDVKNHVIFYNMHDYEKWVVQNPNFKGRIKYLKGLASSTKPMVRQDAQVSPIVCGYFDQQAGQALDIAFKKGLTSYRKQWINYWRDKIDTDVIRRIDQNNPRMAAVEISMYINTKLVEYSIDSFSRALISYKDGLKKSQRQLLHYLLKHWDFGHSRASEEKLSEIAGAASGECKYHHGDLSDTLARMGCDFPGSNNVPFVSQDGSFGTRNKLGKDVGASRYVETRPAAIMKLIYIKELYNMIERNVVQGKDVEPKWIPSLLPMHVINGFLGVATAYSTESPSYHPIDVIDWLMCYINATDPFPLVPWFKGFTGEISMEIFKGRYTKEQKFAMQGQEEVPYYEGLTLTTKGFYRVIGQRHSQYEEEQNGKKVSMTIPVTDIEIKEIPIGVGIAKYRFEVEQNCEKVDDDMADTDSPNMVIRGWRGDVNEKTLGMVNRIGMTNITLIDDNSFPIPVRNIYEVLKLYADNMIELFAKLKEKRIGEVTTKIIDKSKIIKLLELILSDTLIYKDTDEDVIARQLAQHGIEFSYFEKLGFRGATRQGLEKHRRELLELHQKLKELQETHHLAEWNNSLLKLREHFAAQKDYQKYKHHMYPYVYTNITDLLSGKVKSPFAVAEEKLPDAI